MANAVLATVLAGASAQAQTTSVAVPANVEWVDTGVDVRSGVAYLLSIKATGSWTNATGAPSVDAEGYASFKLPGAVAPEQPFASLIGRVNETVFGIGSSFRKRSPASGRLFLAINDVSGTFGDNTGELTVEITRSVNAAVTKFEDPTLFLDVLTVNPQPFYVPPSFRWTLRNKLRPSVSGELHIFLDGLRASATVAPPLIQNLSADSELSGTFVLFTGLEPVLSAGDHVVRIELRALSPDHELLATGTAYLTSFVPSPPPSIVIADFKATPNHQDQGKAIKLSWKLQPTSTCFPADLVLRKRDVGEPSIVAIHEEANPSSLTGEEQVVVAGKSSPLYYTLSVACRWVPNGPTLAVTAKTEERQVTFFNPPPASPIVVNNGPFFTPMSPKHKQPFSVSWTFQNVGSAKSDDFDVQLYVDDAKEGEKQTVPELQSFESTNTTWTVTKELSVGLHKIELKLVSNTDSLGFAQFSVAP